MIVYLDKNYICHASDDGSMRPAETAFFDGKCPEFIEGYRWIPDGESWTNEDGVTFHGDCMMLVKDWALMQRFQAQHDADMAASADMMEALNILGVTE